MRKLLMIMLCFMLVFAAAPDVFADETEETNAPEITSAGSYTVFLQTNEYSSYQWYAWTWGEGTDRWVSPTYGYKTVVKFENLDSNVVFAFNGSANPNPTWDIMTKKTVDIKLDGINNMVVLDGENDQGRLTGYLTMYEEPTENTDNTAATEPPPTEPTENTSAWLTEPTEQTVYTQPTQATQSTQYTQPTQATQSTQYTQPTQATQSPQYTQPTQATQATQTPTKFTQPTVTDPTQPTAATDSSKQLGEASPQLNLRTATVKCGKIITLKVNNKGSKKVKYSSNNSSVAKVSSTGKVSALKKGFARITAKVGSEKLYFTIKVTTSPKLSKASVTIKKGKYKYVLITGKASTVNNVYTNTKKAKILSKNNETKLKVKALRKGSTTLKVKVNGVVLKLKVKIT